MMIESNEWTHSQDTINISEIFIKSGCFKLPDLIAIYKNDENTYKFSKQYG